MKVRERIKWALFPGINLHARQRYQFIPRYVSKATSSAPRHVLDAGCGNGMLSHQSYLRGNKVIGVSIKAREIEGNKRLFNDYLGIPEDDLSFVNLNLYDIESLDQRFDEIICSEVLEHIQRDTELCQTFWRVLKPGGVLHLCCPHAEHPDHVSYILDPEETGGHVRSGYTAESYEALLEPIGFQLSKPLGLGSHVRQGFNKRILAVERSFGWMGGLLLCGLALPFQVFDKPNPPAPYSLYIRATKPIEQKLSPAKVA